MLEDDIIMSDIAILEESDNTDVIETIQIVEVDGPQSFTVDTDSAFAALGEPNEGLRHSLLNSRDLADQHPITAITGLREELDRIEILKTIYSNKYGFANYYLWEDGNIDQEDRFGFFVSLSSERNTIKKYSDVAQEPFGVIVDEAAFIGGQDKATFDYTKDKIQTSAGCGLVSHSGMVCARCESDIVVGDYVIPNQYGVATKSPSNYGYLACGIHDINGIRCVHISLEWSPNQVAALSNEVKDFNGRVGKVEDNIVASMNLAQEAYNKASDIEVSNKDAIDRVDNAVGKVEDAVTKVEDSQQQIQNATVIAVQAKAIAESAATSAETIRSEASATANDALANVNALIKDLQPILMWEDAETGNTGAEYFTTYIENGVATKAEIQTVESLTDDNKSAIEKNANSIQTLVSSVDMYSVGEYSQAYGLTYEQAKSILKIGMVYIPMNHPDGETHIETYEGQGHDNYFTEEWHYVWNGDDWDEYGGSVTFLSSVVPVASGTLKYWYTNSTEAPDGYEPHTLYLWKDEQWVKVNILDGNVNNRITSMIRQTMDEIALEITNARGSITSLSERLDTDEATIQGLVTWKTDSDGNAYNLATIKQTANDAGASIAQVVESVGEDGEVSAASIVTAVNDSGSSVVIKAEHLQLDGVTSFVKEVKQDVKAVQNASIYDVKVEYALSASDTEEPDEDSWDTQAPLWQSGQYMWQRTTITKGNQEISSVATCIQGAKGEDGSSVFVTYNDSEEIPDTPTGNGTSDGWHTNATSSAIWMSQKVAQDIESGEWGEPVKIKGEDGNIGISVVSINPQYCLSETDAVAPTTGWTNDLGSITWTPSNYIWCREEIVYSEGDPSYTTPRIDESLSLVGKWCSAADKTYIDGGKIYTGSITADKLTVNDLSAISANLGTVTAGIIQSSNYVADSAGMKINLLDGTWDSKHFKIASNGDVSMTGNVVATSGEIGGCKIVNGHLEVSSANIGTLSANDIEASSFTAEYMKNTGLFEGEYIKADLIDADEISANIATIGGFNVGETSLYSDGLIISPSGIAMGSGSISFGDAALEMGGGITYDTSGHMRIVAQGGIFMDTPLAGGVTINGPLQVYGEGKLIADTAGLTTTVGNFARLDDLLEALLAAINVSSTYVITYNANKGYGAPASQTKTHNVDLILSSDEPWRSGYTFLGWSRSSTAKYPEYTPGNTYSENANANFYAVWESNGGGGDVETLPKCPECGNEADHQISEHCDECGTSSSSYYCGNCDIVWCDDCGEVLVRN